jgi:uncharacterized protein YegP (UPF0339 family)
MRFVKYKDSQGYWRWTLVAGNNRTIADSGEGYHNEADLDHAIGLIKGTSNIPVHRQV